MANLSNGLGCQALMRYSLKSLFIEPKLKNKKPAISMAGLNKEK